MKVFIFKVSSLSLHQHLYITFRALNNIFTNIFPEMVEKYYTLHFLLHFHLNFEAYDMILTINDIKI